MSEAPAFVDAAEALEALTSFSQLEARGTIRIVLKEAGFRPEAVSAAELAAVVEKILPAELEARGVDQAALIAADIAERVRSGSGDDVGEPSQVALRRLWDR